MHGWAGKLSEALEGAERLDDIFRYLGLPARLVGFQIPL